MGPTFVSSVNKRLSYNHRLLEGKQRDLWHAFCLLLGDLSTRTVCDPSCEKLTMKAAAECLILLISRAEKKEREKQLKLFEFIPLITMSMTVNSGDFDDDYAFQKRISQVLE